MKPLSAPAIPSHTHWERFDNAVGKVLSVPKEEFLKEEARLKRLREKKRTAKKAQLSGSNNLNGEPQ